MTYEQWRISYQSSEQAARAAFQAWQEATAPPAGHEELATQVADLLDQMQNGIKYDEENNIYVLVWTKRQIAEAKRRAEVRATDEPKVKSERCTHPLGAFERSDGTLHCFYCGRVE